MFLSLTFRATWLVSVVCITISVPAQDAIDGPNEPGPTAAQLELVKQLGDDSYFKREAAGEKLASQGLAAKAVLTEALKDPDVEISLRAHRILTRVLRDVFAARLAAFVDVVDGNERHDLPGWKRFRDLVGDRRDSRTMFAQMTRTEGALLAAHEQQLPDTPGLFVARVAGLQALAAHPQTNARVAPETVATLLLIGSDKTAKEHSQGLSQLYVLLKQSAAMPSIGPTESPAIMRILLEEWATSAASRGLNYGMLLALKYDLKEMALKQAADHIGRKTGSSSSLQYAIIAVGRFGGEKHIPLLMPLLENKTVCSRWGNQALKKKGTINVEVRDVALVVLLLLNSKDPANYGFKLLQENAETLYHSYTFGFIDDDEREAAHSKWAAEWAVESANAATTSRG
ncbi:MAG: HEAT repeat protein [Pirellulaceae bacterium]|jgi:HEAT repeat protein